MKHSVKKTTARRSAQPRGFTLTELLIVITILAILSGLSLAALANAAEQARVQRTQAIIGRLNALIMEKWEGYRTRAVPYTRTNDLRQTARNRLYALRELQRLEMPDNADDVWDNPTYLTVVPAINRNYRRRAPSAASWDKRYEEAECLFLIVSAMRDGDRNALDFFGPTEIGDADQDGMLEIHDAWGEPISWLRWAPGYTEHPGSDGQWGVAGTDDDNDGVTDNPTEVLWSGSDDRLPVLTLQTVNGKKSPDTFDPVRVDPRLSNSDATDDTFALVPLIMSGGPDRTLGINVRQATFKYSATTPPNDPYWGANPRIGSLNDEAVAADNITNHALGLGGP